MADLNRTLNYSLRGLTPIITERAQEKIDDHLIINKDDWMGSFASDFKGEIKKIYARHQGHKCAYCRLSLTPDGYTEPIEHITSRELKPFWMFVPHNLVASCGGCNSFKGTTNVLTRPANTYGHPSASCPNSSREYYIFNPHCDTWSEHFEIEDNYFLKPRTNTKGPFTYKELGMYRYHIVLDYMFQEKVRSHLSYRILMQRIRKEKNADKLAALKRALEVIEADL